MASKTKIPVKIKLDTRDHELRKVFIKFTSLPCYLFCDCYYIRGSAYEIFEGNLSIKGSANFSIFNTHSLFLK